MEEPGYHSNDDTGYREAPGFRYGQPTPGSSPAFYQRGLTQEALDRYMRSQGILPNDDNAPQDFTFGDDNSDDDYCPANSASATVPSSPNLQPEDSVSPEPSESDGNAVDIEVDEVSDEEQDEEQKQEQERYPDQEPELDYQDDSVPATQDSAYSEKPDAYHGLLWGYLQPLNRDLETMTFSRRNELYKIGRDGDWADYQLKDPRISKKHCEIEWDQREDGASRVTLRDLDSSNGTWVNKERLHRRAYITLREGDMVSFADPRHEPDWGSNASREDHQDNRYIFHHTANVMVYGTQTFQSN